MKKLISMVVLLLLISGCSTTVKKHTYLKYSGFMEGCANGLVIGVLTAKPDMQYKNINPVWIDTSCMELYLKKLEADDIKPPESINKYLDRNEMI